MTSPTQNLEAEQAILGALLLKQAMPRDLTLDPYDLTDTRNRRVYHAMTELGRFDVVILTDHLARQNRLHEAGGRAYVDLLAAGCPNPGHLREYVRLVKECREEKLWLAAGQRLVDSVTLGDRALRERAVAWIKGDRPSNVIDLQARRDAA